jgi:simple sugar transport system permease protein
VSGLPRDRDGRAAAEWEGDVSEITEPKTAAVFGGPARTPDGQRSGWMGVLRRSGTIFIQQREASVLVVLAALVAYFWVATPAFGTKLNFINLTQGIGSAYAIVAIGEVLLLVCGEIDLSVGFIWALAPFLMHYFIDFYHFPAILGILAAYVCGALIGLINGLIRVVLNVPSFIGTLGMSFLLYGFMLVTSNSEAVPVSPNAEGIGHWFGTYAWAEIIWAVVLVAIFHVVLTRTRWGLHTIAVGGNAVGAAEAGINAGKIKIGNFMITGLLGAVAGIMEAFRNNTIDPSAGGYTPMFYAVAAAVIGGTALAGGSGTVLGALLGMFVLATLQDGFNLKGISADPFNIILGIAIIAAMVANVYLTRLRKAGRT